MTTGADEQDLKTITNSLVEYCKTTYGALGSSNKFEVGTGASMQARMTVGLRADQCDALGVVVAYVS